MESLRKFLVPLLIPKEISMLIIYVLWKHTDLFWTVKLRNRNVLHFLAKHLSLGEVRSVYHNTVIDLKCSYIFLKRMTGQTQHNEGTVFNMLVRSSSSSKALSSSVILTVQLTASTSSSVLSQSSAIS